MKQEGKEDMNNKTSHETWECLDQMQQKEDIVRLLSENRF